MSDLEFEDDGASTRSVFNEDFSEEDAIFESEGENENSSSLSSSKKRRARPAPLVTCYLCQRRLNSLQGYKKHLKLHFTAGRISHEVIEVAKSLLYILEVSLWTFVDFITELIWDCIPKSASMQISGFHSAYTMAVNTDVVCDSSIRSSAVSKVKDILGIGDEKGKALKFLVGDFMIKMASTIESFYFKCIREPKESMLYGGKESVPVATDNPDDVNVQSSIYYIGGSSVRSVMNKAIRATKSTEWKKIVSCLLERFISGSLSSAPMSEVIPWTASRDREGLISISESAWSFLMALSQVLVQLEKSDGSILRSEVYQSVKSDEILYNMLWCDLVGKNLLEEERDFLLQKVCEYFTNTWGVGVMLRKTNALKGKSRDKVALRASLL